MSVVIAGDDDEKTTQLGNVTRAVENPQVSNAKAHARSREEALDAISSQLRNARREFNLANAKAARLTVEIDQDSAFRAASNAARIRLQHTMDKLGSLRLATLLANDAAVAVQWAVEDGRAHLEALQQHSHALNFKTATLNDERLAAESACAARGDLVDTTDQRATPETAATTSAGGQLGYAFRSAGDITDVLRDARRDEAKVRVHRDDAAARRTNKEACSAALAVKVRDGAARRELLNVELDTMRDALVIAKAKLEGRERKQQEQKCISRVWQRAGELFSLRDESILITSSGASMGLHPKDIEYKVAASLYDLRNYEQSYDDKNDNFTEKEENNKSSNGDNQNLSREQLMENSTYPSPHCVAELVRDTADHLRTELKKEEARRHKLIQEVDTLQQEATRRRPLFIALARAKTECDFALTDLETTKSDICTAETVELALQDEVAAGTEQVAIALSKTALAMGNTEVLRASLLVAHGHVERVAAEAERMRSAAIAAEHEAVRTNVSLDQKRSFTSRAARVDARGLVTRSALSAARTIVDEAAIRANIDRESLTRSVQQQLWARDAAGGESEKQTRIIDTRRRERRNNLATHIATLAKLHSQHARADEETETLRETISDAAHSANHYDKLVRDALLRSSHTYDGIISTVSMHLRRDVNVIEVNAKRILELRQNLVEDTVKKKSALQKVVHFRSDISANLDLARAKHATIQNELDIYRKLKVYRTNQF